MNSVRKYAIDYKPTIYSVSFKIKYYDKKYEPQLTSANKYVAKEAQKHIKEFDVPLIIVLLNDKLEFPTERNKQKTITKCWKRHGLKQDITNYNLELSELKIINNHGRVSYDFDETKE